MFHLILKHTHSHAHAHAHSHAHAHAHKAYFLEIKNILAKPFSQI